MGGGVGGGGSGGMLRTVGRAVTTTRTGVTNLQEPISSSSSSTGTTTSPASPTAANSRPAQQNRNGGNQLSLSAAAALTASPFGSHNNVPVPVPAHYGVPGWSSFGVGGGGGSCCDEYEWVSVDGLEEDFDKTHGFLVDDFALGPVPSLDEVNTAVSALQQVLDPASYPGLVRDKFASNSDRNTELDWIEPSLYLSNSRRMLQPYPADRVYDAFHLLQTEPSIQRMVISLSSDKAVWNAVLNNEAVRELKESFNAAETSGSESSDENSDDSNPAINIIRWIFVNTQAKVMEVIEKITNIVNDLFKHPDDENATKGAAAAGASDSFEEKLRTSFLLSIVVLLVVVVTRTSRA